MEEIGFKAVFKTGEATQEIGSLRKSFMSMFSSVERDSKEASERSENSTNNSIKSIEKTMEKFSAWTVAKGQLIAQSIMTGIYTLKNSIMTMIPALSQSMEMAKNVMIANLAYPLAQEVIPLLQSMFKWVRENRIVFAKMGTVLVSVFRVISGLVGGVFKAIKKGMDSFLSVFTSARINMAGFIDFMNFLLFKISFIFTYILVTAEPIIEKIGLIFGKIFKNYIEPFISGIALGFSEKVIPVVNELVGLINDLLNPMESLSEATDSTRDGMNSLGLSISGSLMEGLHTLIKVVRKVVSVMTEYKDETLLVAGIMLAAMLPAITATAVGFGTAFVRSIVASTVSVKAFTVALMSNPIFWIGAVIVGIVYGLYKLNKNWNSISSSMNEGWASISEKLEYFYDLLVEKWNIISGKFMKKLEPIRKILIGVWDDAKKKFNSWARAIENTAVFKVLASAVKGISDAFSGVSGQNIPVGNASSVPANNEIPKVPKTKPKPKTTYETLRDFDMFDTIGGIFKAKGGSVKAGKSYVVGEEGMEIFTPSTAGVITPNNKIAKTGTNSYIDEKQFVNDNRNFTITIQSNNKDEIVREIKKIVNDKPNYKRQYYRQDVAR